MTEPLSPQRLAEIESNLRVAIEGYLGSDRALDALLAEVERLQRAEAERDQAREALKEAYDPHAPYCPADNIDLKAANCTCKAREALSVSGGQALSSEQSTGDQQTSHERKEG